MDRFILNASSQSQGGSVRLQAPDEIRGALEHLGESHAAARGGSADKTGGGTGKSSPGAVSHIGGNYCFDVATTKIQFEGKGQPIIHRGAVFVLNRLGTSKSTLYVTGDHLIWCENEAKWKPAGEFKVTDSVKNYDGTASRVVENTPSALTTDLVFNLETTFHTFYANGILVHNGKVNPDSAA